MSYNNVKIGFSTKILSIQSCQIKSVRLTKSFRNCQLITDNLDHVHATGD